MANPGGGDRYALEASEEASDTTDMEMEGLLSRSRQCTSPVTQAMRQRAVCAMTLAVSMGLVAAVLSIASASVGNLASISDALGLSTDPVAHATLFEDYIDGKGKNATGCSNWYQIELFRTTTDDQECARLCGETQGCASFNYQRHPCTGAEQDAARSCLLFKEGCQEESNPCWELWHTSFHNPEVQWKLDKASRGCSNWDTILYGFSERINLDSCGHQCVNTPGCVAFGWQATRCPDPSRGTSIDNQCILFKGNCSYEPNDCWDHYVVEPAWMPTTVSMGPLLATTTIALTTAQSTPSPRPGQTPAPTPAATPMPSPPPTPAPTSACLPDEWMMVDAATTDGERLIFPWYCHGAPADFTQCTEDIFKDGTTFVTPVCNDISDTVTPTQPITHLKIQAAQIPPAAFGNSQPQQPPPFTQDSCMSRRVDPPVWQYYNSARVNLANVEYCATSPKLSTTGKECPATCP